MMLTRKSLERRTFLRGVGVTLALPFLDAMIPAFSKAAVSAPARRLGFYYIPNGAIMDRWTPNADGKSFEMTPILFAIRPARTSGICGDSLTFIQGRYRYYVRPLGSGAGRHVRRNQSHPICWRLRS